MDQNAAMLFSSIVFKLVVLSELLSHEGVSTGIEHYLKQTLPIYSISLSFQSLIDMALIRAFAAFSLTHLGLGSPLMSSYQINNDKIHVRGVECNPHNMIYDVVSCDRGTEYFNCLLAQSDYDCNKKYTLDSNGHCSSGIPSTPGAAGCSAYCEIRLTMTYGQEVPYSDGYCPGNTVCTVTTGTSITVTNTYTINGGTSIKKRDGEDPVELSIAFNLGASYSYSTSLTYTVTTGLQQPAQPNVCGYWTFVPYMMG
jgi:hypothetical protein